MVAQNTDFFIVQSSYMAMQLSYKLDFDINKILVLPFYPPLNSTINSNFLKEKNTFLYVSGGALHKNHIRLIEAFALFYIKNKKGTLLITISNPSKKLDNLIQDCNKKHIPIVNLGEMPRENLVEYYQKSEYLIYPSLAESFGLGLIEGLEFDCKVIGADLPYTYEICKPSLVFNPFDVAEIENAFYVASTTELPSSVKKIDNKIDELIQLLNLDTTPPR
jgi:glycosyltransferase involved in cell wall biosynthesis